MARSGKKRGVRARDEHCGGRGRNERRRGCRHPARFHLHALVDLAALIVVGSSTNRDGAGIVDYFRGKFSDPIYTGPNGDDITYVNFLAGPLGIKAALEANAGEHNAVIAAGWGAANVGLLLAVEGSGFQDTVVVMVGDVARPDGGFGTRYPWFSLIGVNPLPTPSDVPALAAVNTGYEYDYNSNAPADVLESDRCRQFAGGLSEHARNQAELDLPVNADGTPSVSATRTRAPSRPAAPCWIAPTPAAARPGRQDHGLRHDAGQHHLRHLHDR